MKLTEERIRNIIREELSRLSEMGGGDEYAVYEIEPKHLIRFEDGEHPMEYGIKMREGSQDVLHNWAQRQGWAYRPGDGFGEKDKYVDRKPNGKKFYVIAKNK